MPVNRVKSPPVAAKSPPATDLHNDTDDADASLSRLGAELNELMDESFTMDDAEDSLMPSSRSPVDDNEQSSSYLNIPAMVDPHALPPYTRSANGQRPSVMQQANGVKQTPAVIRAKSLQSSPEASHRQMRLQGPNSRHMSQRGSMEKVSTALAAAAAAKLQTVSARPSSARPVQQSSIQQQSRHLNVSKPNSRRATDVQAIAKLQQAVQDAKAAKKEIINTHRQQQQQQGDSAINGSLRSNIHVVVRVRPLNSKELQCNAQRVIRTVQQKMVVLNRSLLVEANDFLRQGRVQDSRYAFDHVFDELSTQSEVYTNTAQALIPLVMQGYNSTVFAYGQTGSGKTHTMLGSESEPGIMFRTLNDLFQQIQQQSQHNYKITISYIEIYNEVIRDLLNPHRVDAAGNPLQLEIRDDPQRGSVVADITELVAVNTNEVMELLQRGNQFRTTESTAANEVSSRSHAILTIIVERREKTASVDETVNVGKLSLIDLAGSERASNTRNRGQRLVEGAAINKSLLALANCINALGSKKAQAHINYRDSKLTRLLKDSLGGNTKTVMIAAISPASDKLEETNNTLKYANRAKQIKTVVESNVTSVQHQVEYYNEIIRRLRAEVNELKLELEAAHREQQSEATENHHQNGAAHPQRLNTSPNNKRASQPSPRHHRSFSSQQPSPQYLQLSGMLDEWMILAKQQLIVQQHIYQQKQQHLHHTDDEQSSNSLQTLYVKARELQSQLMTVEQQAHALHAQIDAANDTTTELLWSQHLLVLNQIQQQSHALQEKQLLAVKDEEIRELRSQLQSLSQHTSPVATKQMNGAHVQHHKVHSIIDAINQRTAAAAAQRSYASAVVQPRVDSNLTKPQSYLLHSVQPTNIPSAFGNGVSTQPKPTPSAASSTPVVSKLSQILTGSNHTASVSNLPQPRLSHNSVPNSLPSNNGAAPLPQRPTSQSGALTTQSLPGIQPSKPAGVKSSFAALQHPPTHSSSVGASTALRAGSQLPSRAVTPSKKKMRGGVANAQHPRPAAVQPQRAAIRINPTTRRNAAPSYSKANDLFSIYGQGIPPGKR